MHIILNFGSLIPFRRLRPYEMTAAAVFTSAINTFANDPVHSSIKFVESSTIQSLKSRESKMENKMMAKDVKIS